VAACVFCEIVAGRSEAAVVLDEPEVLAFLDVRPVFAGHVLVVPREHHRALPDLPARLLPILFEGVQRLSAAVPRALGAEGTFVAANNRVSQSVPHLHVHVVPRTKGDGLRGFFWPRTRYESDEALAATAERIRSALLDGSGASRGEGEGSG
jgi:histidine triad (HIT) family protein